MILGIISEVMATLSKNPKRIRAMTINVNVFEG